MKLMESIYVASGLQRILGCTVSVKLHPEEILAPKFYDTGSNLTIEATVAQTSGDGSNPCKFWDPIMIPATQI